MLTIFAVPKPFDGLLSVIQTNAIRSWVRLRPRCQLVLCGDEPGTREAAAEAGADWVPGIARNEFGTPLVSSVFRAAEERAIHPLLCYVNADVVLLSDFTTAAQRAAEAKRRFLMIGQRWDLDVRDALAFAGGDWESDLKQRVEKEGRLHPPWGSDYFVYPRGLLGELPTFAVGRPAWDNWVIYRARQLRAAVVDASDAATVIHQTHGYEHVQEGGGASYEGPEAERNRALIGSGIPLFSILDATHRLTPTALVRARSAPHLRRRLRTEAILAPLPFALPSRLYRTFVRLRDRRSAASANSRR